MFWRHSVIRPCNLPYLAAILILTGSAFDASRAQTLNFVAELPDGAFFQGAINSVTNKLAAHATDNIYTIDLTTKAVDPLATAYKNSFMEVNPTKNKIYAVAGADLLMIDAGTKAVRRLTPFAEDIAGMNLDAPTDQVFVATVSGRFAQIDGQTFTVAATTAIGPDISALIPNLSEGAVYVAYNNTNPAFMSIVTSTIDPVTKQVTLTNTDYPISDSQPGLSNTVTLAFNSVTNKLYFTAPDGGAYYRMVEMDLATRQQKPIGDNPHYSGIDVNSVTNKLYAISISGRWGYAESVSIFDGLTGTVEEINIGQGPLRSLAVNPTADQVYVTGQSTLTIIDGPTRALTTIPLTDKDGPAARGAGPIIINPVTNRVYVVVGNPFYGKASLMELVQTPVMANLIDAVEVTQSVQDLTQSVPLFAGKPTLVRIYINSSRTGQGFGGTLFVYRDGAAPVIVRSTNTMAYTDASLADRRGDLAKSVNFILPSTLTGEGRVRIDVTDLSWTPPYSAWIQLDREPPSLPFFRREITFQPALEMRLRVIGFYYQRARFPIQQPRDLDYSLLQSWLGRAYPISALTFSNGAVQPVPVVSGSL
jgi:hypothetical protein